MQHIAGNYSKQATRMLEKKTVGEPFEELCFRDSMKTHKICIYKIAINYYTKYHK